MQDVADSAVSVHPVVERAAAGMLPEWAVAGAERRAHMERVAELLGRWAADLGLPDHDRLRWRAVGFLHDALRDEEPGRLRDRVPPAWRALPGQLLHGPAAAERLRVDGVLDGELLRAVACHTVGDPEFGPLGRALYAADFLESGRPFLADWRASLRSRMPGDLDGVVREILGRRITHLVEKGMTVHPQTLEYWNRLVEHGR